MNTRSNCLSILLLGTAIGLATTTGNRATVTAAPPPAYRPGRILVVRGVLNVFSLGLDGLACKLSQRGYRVDVALRSVSVALGAQVRTEVLVGDPLGGISSRCRDSNRATAPAASTTMIRAARGRRALLMTLPGQRPIDGGTQGKYFGVSEDPQGRLVTPHTRDCCPLARAPLYARP